MGEGMTRDEAIIAAATKAVVYMGNCDGTISEGDLTFDPKNNFFEFTWRNGYLRALMFKHLHHTEAAAWHEAAVNLEMKIEELQAKRQLCLDNAARLEVAE